MAGHPVVRIFFLFTATPVAYGSSWARGQIKAAAVSYAIATATQIQATAASYAAAYGNAKSLTH